MNWRGIRWLATLLGLLGLAMLLMVGGIIFIIRSPTGPLSLVISAFGAVAFVLFLARMDIPRVLKTLELVGAVFPLIAFVLVTDLMGPTNGSLRFAEVGAQVIVVLLLVLAVDARFFRLQVDRDRLEVTATILTMIFLAAGEFYALQSLLTGNPRHSEMVAGAIAAGFAAVAITALAGSVRLSETNQSE